MSETPPEIKDGGEPAPADSQDAPRTGPVERACVVLLLLIHSLLLARIGYVSSPTMDEVGHLPAGVSHLLSGRFDLYRVNPPLVRSLAAIPVVLARPQMDWSHYSLGPRARAEFYVGVDFLEANGYRSFWLFTLARWACIPLSVIGGYVCYRWAGELYSRSAGLLALSLWCFEPNVLANGAQITPDAGAAALGVLAAYAFWHWLKVPDWPRTLFAGLTLGVAEVTKTTWVILFALWPLLWLCWRVSQRDGVSRPFVVKQSFRLAVILIMGLYTINLTYGFEGTFTRLGDYRFISKTLAAGGSSGRDGGNRFAGHWTGSIPVPLPANYVRGIDVQKYDFERGLVTYLAGELRQPGWWYYYLYAAVVKVPLGLWSLALVATAVTIGRRGATRPRDEMVLLAPAALVLVLVSSQTGINRHFRYVLPALPAAIIWASKSATLIDRRHAAATACVLAAAGWSAAGSLCVFPHSLSYFNEVAGGPTGGPEHLLDSNIDWGQDLLHLKRWLEAHPEATGLRLAYFGSVDPKLAGIDALLPPRGPASGSVSGGDHGPLPGWYAVSVNYVYGYPHQPSDRPYFTYFRHFRPEAMAGYSIYIYHITREQAEEVRNQLKMSRMNL